MPSLVEIGPSNASQGQHRRKDADEQIKICHSLGVEPMSQAIYIYVCISVENELERLRTLTSYAITCLCITDVFLSYIHLLLNTMKYQETNNIYFIKKNVPKRKCLILCDNIQVR